MRKKLLQVLLLIVLYSAFLLWYNGIRDPLTPTELDHFIHQIKEKSGTLHQTENEQMSQFRELCKDDDGEEFYMVNLMKFKTIDEDGTDPMEAHNKYIKTIVPALLKRAAHPVFMSSVMGKFIHPQNADEWDDVAIIRYRSRRDMLKMVVDLAGGDAGENKYSALENTQVFPVKVKIVGIPVQGIMTIFFLLLMGIIILRKRRVS